MADPGRVQLGQAIRSCRERAGLSQRALALRLGWSRSRLAEIERGRFETTLTMLRCLARVLNVSQAVLISPPAPTCAECGGPRDAHRPWQRYCSTTCRTRAFKRRRAAASMAPGTHGNASEARTP